MSRKRILVTTYFSYKDALIQTYTLPYVRLILKSLPKRSRVYLVTIEKPEQAISKDEEKNILDGLKREGIHLVRLRYSSLGFFTYFKMSWYMLYLALLSFIKKIDVIHGWCTPGGSIGYLISLFTFKPLVIDSYEPHAEAMVENGDWSRKSLAFRLLFGLEKLLSKRASCIISATEGMRDYARKKYGVTFDRFYVKPACVNLDLFSKNNIKKPELVAELGLEGKVVCVYAGKFGGIYMEEETFGFFKKASDYWGEKFRVLLLTNHTDEEISSYCMRAGLDSSIIIKRFVMHHEVPDYMGLGDFGITPVKPVPTKRYCTPIKDGEYWALGLPVVITENISDDSSIIEKYDIGAVIRSFDEKGYIEAIEKTDQLLQGQEREAIFNKIRNIAIKYRDFEIAERTYSEIYKDI